MKEIALIVDDSLTIRMDLAEAFVSAGFEAVPCGTVAEARAAATASEVAVVVLDVELPDGDGVSLLQELRAMPGGEELAILMLSSFTEVQDRARGLRTGADEYVGKPYDTGYVVARARELVRSRRGDRSPAVQTVLVIDDSATFRAELSAMLAQAGYRVCTAEDGERGLRIAADDRPNAIVVDGLLPGIDGATVIRRIRLDAALRTVPCVLLTGSGDHGTELRALDAGADAFVRKDEDPEAILARIQAVLRRQVTAAGDRSTSLGPRKILAVDDSGTYLETLGTSLRGDGYDVVLARSGEDALDLLAIQPVDCILLDLVMPGIGGQETCRRIKSAPAVRDIPLIMLTAIEDRSAMLAGLAAGADDFIAKSGELTVLKARLRAQLRRKQVEDETRRIREELLSAEIEAAEARSARELARTQTIMVDELAAKNAELEAFAYSVSHDLRAPLRAILGFAGALVEDSPGLDPTAQAHIQRVMANARRMNELIDDLLALSRIGRADLRRGPVDVTALAREVAAELGRRDPTREVEIQVEDGIVVDADGQLLRIALENLIGNAWKFTTKVAHARIEVTRTSSPHGPAVCVKDNGAGFDPQQADRLFRPFRRLHAERDFEGTGIGLATVHRIVDRHAGKVWAEGEPGRGAAFYFTIGRPHRSPAPAPPAG